MHTDPEATAVRELTRRLGLPGVVDVHTHFMPKPVMDKVWGYFDAAGPLVGREWPIAYRQDEDERVQRLRDFGVLAFTSMLYPHKPGMAAWLNSWATDFAARTPDCLHTATFYPEPEAADYVARAIDRGARVFKSHVQVGDYDPSDPLLDPVWGQLQEAGIPTVIHCGSGPAPGRFTGPAPIRAVLQRFPRLPLVIAHMGMPEYREFLDLAQSHRTVCLDTTMAFTAFVNEMMPMPADQVRRLGGLGDRILFGSDFPNIPYPYLEAVEAVTGLGLDESWQRAVLHDNAVRLFGLSLDE
ncbi:MAG: amidohydrolase [Intrasporangium sp.]|uniref:amidohydrolase family protein n=1 Tax=Intrasporangium sp. TaxID=1925024 RepID=UPI0026484AD2|nr:amidohydrolase family protein [Intrasporangium sp.]MDN5796480.1 amidohydrolase [Intrasporangium sp.]